MAGKMTRILYIERKSGHNDDGPARIGRVAYSHTGRTLYYWGRAFRSHRGSGIGANYFDVATGESYWISGPKRDGTDRHWAGSGPVEIDPEIADEYWREVRRCDPPRGGAGRRG
jgi:hypothetical protein